MHPLRMVIKGEYWDSFLYSGRLYLFQMDGSIRTVNWDKLVDSLIRNKQEKLALECGFRNSGYLYRDEYQIVFSDHEIKKIIVARFEQASSSIFSLSDSEIQAFTISHQENRFPFPHADATIYMNLLYVGSPSGVNFAECSRKTKNALKSKVDVLCDMPARSIEPSYEHLAVAAGSDGLFEIPVAPSNDNIVWKPGGRRITKRHCDDCQWAFDSIYGSSHVGEGLLAQFTTEHRDTEAKNGPKWNRELERLIDAAEIFGSTGYSFATHDKIYQSNAGRLIGVRYLPWAKNKNEQFTQLGDIQLAAWKGEVISGSAALFGTIVECENAIVLLLSDETIQTLEGEPINWRTFTRSKNYENQLHVVYDDRLEIYSFNHDYFVDQYSKRCGIFHSGSRRRGH